MDTNYGFIIEKTGKKIRQELQRKFALLGLDVTVDQWIVLLELHQKGSISQVELAEFTFKDAPTVTRIIDLLLKKELVEKEMCSDDRRKFKIHLTKKGNALCEKLLPQVIDFRKEGWNGLSLEDMNDLKRIMQKIFQNLNSN